MARELPDKLYFKIGEVSRLADLKPSVLRYWETEFSQLKPKKSPAGQRLYSKKDIDLIRHIKKLLYNDKLTISGARKIISHTSMPQKENGAEIKEILSYVRNELLIVRQALD